jgi:acyl-CoA synthetase (AMP-forming)/AMP-acid ligase II
MKAMNLADIILGLARLQPDVTALESGDVCLTYSDLVKRASQGARFLQGTGIGTGDRVGIALQRQEETVAAAVAVWMLGATPVFLDFRARPSEKRSYAENFSIRAIIETRNAPEDPGYEPILARGGWLEAVAGEDDSTVEPVSARHPAILSLTSGTTGTPQGIAINHNTFLNRYLAHRTSTLGYNGGLFVCSLPLSYTAPRIHTLCHLFDGGTVHFLPVLAGAEELADAYVRLKARAAFIVPPQLNGLLELSAGRTTPMFPDLRSLTVAGAPVSAENNVRAYKELTPGYRVDYGSSICCPMISELTGQDVLDRPGSVGRPHVLTHIRIAGANGEALPQGENGIIMIRSPCIADAILGEERENSDRLTDGWAIPGDLGYIDDEGFLILTGRASDMIIRNGVNVFPRELENALAKHPEVKEVAVVGFPSPESGEEIAAFIVASGDVTVEKMAVYARASINADKCPREFRIIEALPRNAAGKVEKKKLVAIFTGEDAG